MHGTFAKFSIGKHGASSKPYIFTCFRSDQPLKSQAHVCQLYKLIDQSLINNLNLAIVTIRLNTCLNTTITIRLTAFCVGHVASPTFMVLSSMSSAVSTDYTSFHDKLS